MIITHQKKIEEILGMLEPFKKIFIIGCGGCSTVCLTGGEDQVKEMVIELKNKKITGTVVVESPCFKEILQHDTLTLAKEMEEAEAILCMSCGVGVQNIAEYTNKICVPCLDTKFVGQVERSGVFQERCRACGVCVLFETGGICPIVRCPKSMLNGPCGGMYDGKCEVGGYIRDCAWVLIYDRLNKWGMKERLRTFKSPRDYSKLNVEPKELILVEKEL